MLEDVSKDMHTCDVEHHIVHFYMDVHSTRAIKFSPFSHEERGGADVPVCRGAHCAPLQN